MAKSTDRPMVQTVLGPLPPEQLGPTLTHEHLFLDGTAGGPDWSRHYIDDISDTLADLSTFRKLGGAAMVDVTTRGLGLREPMLRRRLSAATGVHVIQGTGWYTEPFYPPEVEEKSVEQLARILERDLCVGIDGTEIRAGIIGEIGTRRGRISTLEEKVFCAAAIACRRTGAAITTHTDSGALAVEQVELLQREGVPGDRIIVGHLDNRIDLALLEEVLAAGVYAEFDGIGQENFSVVTGVSYPSDGERAGAIAHLLEEGHAERILLASDACAQHYLISGGGKGRSHVLGSFVEELRRAGVSDGAIETMLVANPRRVLPF